VGAGVTRGRVLLDRDGTINRQTQGEYVVSPNGMVLLPGAAEGLRAMRDAGFGLAVVSNQAPVARGWITQAELGAVNDRLRALLKAEGVQLDGIYCCPHDRGDGCACRKPEPGLLLRAAADLGFDPRDAFLVGDKASDIEAGRRAGATTIRVLTDEGAEHRGAPADHVVADLHAAAAIIAGHAEEEAL
jgi:D-glycero-D-manno-heptose 1,7-bisphosphate phosphatase